MPWKHSSERHTSSGKTRQREWRIMIGNRGFKILNSFPYFFFFFLHEVWSSSTCLVKSMYDQKLHSEFIHCEQRETSKPRTSSDLGEIYLGSLFYFLRVNSGVFNVTCPVTIFYAATDNRAKVPASCVTASSSKTRSTPTACLSAQRKKPAQRKISSIPTITNQQLPEFA